VGSGGYCAGAAGATTGSSDRTIAIDKNTRRDISTRYTAGCWEAIQI
jgi:hypothetical protein